jgi:hypothetical protein
MRSIVTTALLFAVGFTAVAYSQQAGDAPRNPELSPKVKPHWDKAGKALAAAREEYRRKVQKALDDFAKQVEKAEPGADGKKLCEKLKAEHLDDAPEVVVPVFGPGILNGPNNHKYKLIDENLSWAEAKKKCEKEDGHLLVIDNPEELAFIRKCLTPVLEPGKDQFWMGANKNEKGAWVWLTGQAMANIGWEANHPVPDAGKDFLVMNEKGKYINARGNNQPGMRFICEWEGR